jgi:hypothetical protein
VNDNVSDFAATASGISWIGRNNSKLNEREGSMKHRVIVKGPSAVSVSVQIQITPNYTTSSHLYALINPQKLAAILAQMPAFNTPALLYGVST